MKLYEYFFEIGLCSVQGEIKCSIVLAGDPKQLDAVTISKHATNFGYKTSFMEHLLTKVPAYQRNPNDDLDPCCIVQLYKNYRSHSNILSIASKLFYDGRLEAKANTGYYKCTPSILFILKNTFKKIFFFLDATHSFIGLDFLPNKQFPLIFDSVNGACKQFKNESSCHNMDEVFVVVDYIKKILDFNWNGKQFFCSDIGVISPYKKQCELIKEKLGDTFSDISVGTAEVFQGQERRIIIISTVRTTEDLGFVNNYQVCTIN